MAKRAPADERRKRASEEAKDHGGLVTLVGGPAGGFWYWRDEWERGSTTWWYRAGYAETGEQVENRNVVDPTGVNLRWYGPGTVFRFDPALIPPSKPRPDPQPVPLAFCACGERLLLLREDRTQCERCRLGTPGPFLIWLVGDRRPAPELEEWELPAEEIPDPESPPELPSPAAERKDPEPPPPDPAQVADWVWRQVAHLYDR